MIHSKITYEGSVYEDRSVIITGSKISLVKVWARNRPADESKIEEITESIKNGLYTPTALVGYFKVKNGKLSDVFITEGQHRLKAIQNMLKSDPSVVERMLLNQIQVQGLVNPPMDLVRRRFQQINKMCPATEMFTDLNVAENQAELNEYYKDVMKAFVCKYPCNKSTSNRPHPPNYNQFQFLESFRRMCTEHKKFNFMTIDAVMDIFDQINNDYQLAIQEDLQSNMDLKEKTKLQKRFTKAGEKGKCFLFVKGQELWVNDFIHQ